MFKKKLSLLSIPVFIGVFLLFFIEFSFVSSLAGKSKNQKDYKLLGKAISLIKNEYIEEPNPFKTLEGAFKSMVDSLDVLSAYLEEPLRKKYISLPSTAFKEPGLIIYKKYGSYPQIIGIRENSPAAGKDLKIGDFISAIDEQSTLTMSMQEVHLLMKDESDKPIRLKVLKPTKTEDITLDRKHPVDELYSYLPLEKTYGILRIHQLFSPCAARIEEELRQRITVQNMPLILDLRNCIEGKDDVAVRLVNLFLQEDKIGYFSNRNGPTQYLSCPDEPEFADVPLIIWTNRATFGPAEIAAAVLQESKRAKVIGLKTSGLTARQNLFVLDDGSGLLLTTQIFHLQSGEPVWQKGVQPDVKMSSGDLTSDAYVEKTYNLIRDM